MRRGWFKSDGVVDIEDVGFRLYLSQLAIDTLLRLYFLTYAVCDEHLGAESWDSLRVSPIDDTGESYSKVNMMPIVLPSEFNIPSTDLRVPNATLNNAII